MVILNPTEGGAVAVSTNNDHHVLSPARGSPIVPSLPGAAETYGLQNALKRWKALEQQSIPLENNAQEYIYARERKDFDDLRRRYFESKRSKMETSSSSATTTTPPAISMRQQQNAGKILERQKQQQQMPNLTNFVDFNNVNYNQMINNTMPMLNNNNNNRNDFYTGQMPIMDQRNFTPNFIKERPKSKRKISTLDDDIAADADFQPSTKQRRKIAMSSSSRPANNVASASAIVPYYETPAPPPILAANGGVFFQESSSATTTITSSSNQLLHVPDLPDDVVARFVNDSSNRLFDDVWKNADLNEFFEPNLQNYSESNDFVPLTAAQVQPQFSLDSSSIFDRNFAQFPQQQSQMTAFNYAPNSQNFHQFQQQQPTQLAQFQMAPQQNLQFYNNNCQQRISAYDSSETIRSMQRYANFDQFF